MADPFLAHLGLPLADVDRLILTAVRPFFHAYFKEHHRDWSIEDLVAEGRTKVFARLKRYKRKLAKATTWVTRVARDTMKDLVRVLGRRKRREDGYRSHVRVFSPEEQEPLIEWLEDVYLRVQETHRRFEISEGERSLTASQETALIALRNRTGHTVPQTVQFLNDHPALARAMGLNRPIREWEVKKARKSVTKINLIKKVASDSGA